MEAASTKWQKPPLSQINREEKKRNTEEEGLR